MTKKFSFRSTAKAFGFFLLLISFSTLSAQNGTGFLLLKNSDTLSVERYSVKDNVTEGRVLFQQKIPVKYQFTTNDREQLEKLSVKILNSGASEAMSPMQEGTMEFKGDKIFTLSKKGGLETWDTITTENGAMAYHPNLPMLSLLEQIVIRAKNLQAVTGKLPVYLIGNNRTVSAEYDFSKTDSVSISLGSIVVDLAITSEGEILGGETKDGLLIKKVNSIPNAALTGITPDYSAPENAPYTAEEVKIRTKAGHTLVGTLTIPKNAEKPVPVVVTISGSSPQDRDHNTPFGGEYKFFRHLADTLGRSGIAVLRMDDRGVGESTGNFESATTAERADDTREGISFISGQERLDHTNIVLVGLSEGAVIAPMVATTNENLSGIVSMAGTARPGREILKYQLENQIKTIDSLSVDDREKMFQKKMKELPEKAKDDEWLKFFLDYDPLETAKKVSDVPVLILHGSTDKNVPPEDAETLAKTFRKAGNSDVTLKIFEDVNHIFVQDKNGNPENYENLESFKVAPEVMASIVDWIKNQTSGKK